MSATSRHEGELDTLPARKPNHSFARKPKSPLQQFFWRRRMWFESTFVFSMLEPWEKVMLCTSFFVSSSNMTMLSAFYGSDYHYSGSPIAGDRSHQVHASPHSCHAQSCKVLPVGPGRRCKIVETINWEEELLHASSIVVTYGILKMLDVRDSSYLTTARFLSSTKCFRQLRFLTYLARMQLRSFYLPLLPDIPPLIMKLDTLRL